MTSIRKLIKTSGLFSFSKMISIREMISVRQISNG